MNTSPSQETVDDYYRALGMLAVAHSEMEYWMKAFANLMINPWSEASDIMTSDLPSQPLRGKLLSLYRNSEDNANRITAFEKLLERISRHTTDRNNMIHSYWFFFPLVNAEAPVRVQAKSKDSEPKQRHVPISEIMDLVNRIRQSTKELQRISFEWETEHDTPRITTPGEEDESDE